MEGIPAPDVADFKRRKEIELGLAAGSISQPQAKRPKIDNRVISEDELRRQLQEHRALMGLNNPEPSTAQESTSTPAVYAAPQTYAAPPVSLAPSMPPVVPPSPFPPMPPGVSGVPPGFPFPPGMAPPGYIFFIFISQSTNFENDCSSPGFPLPPGVVPPFPPPSVSVLPPMPPGFVPPQGMPPQGMPPPGFSPPAAAAPTPPPPRFVPAQNAQSSTASPAHQSEPTQQGHSEIQRPEVRIRQPVLTLPNPSLSQTNPEFRKQTDLKFKDANFSPVRIYPLSLLSIHFMSPQDEHRAVHPKYFCPKLETQLTASQEEPRGKKRARAEDFL